MAGNALDSICLTDPNDVSRGQNLSESGFDGTGRRNHMSHVVYAKVFVNGYRPSSAGPFGHLKGRVGSTHSA